MKVTFVQCEIPAYRQGVFDLLSERLPAQLTLVAGGDYFDHHGRVQIVHPALRPAGNHYLGGRRVLWQTGIWRPALGADVTVIELNPRILSNWVILIARRILRRRTIVWGHAFPRGGSERATDRLRHIMRRLASGVVVYTHQQAEALRQLMPNASVAAAPNALYSTRDHPLVPRNADQAVNIVYVGRLIEVKKPELLLEAFAAVVDELPPATNLMFVGEGPLRSSLEESAAEAGISDRVRFHGEVIEYDDLSEVYASALVNACPGYAGLSITQSYWFGVPTIIARDDRHSPEIEAAAEGFNTVFFQSDSADDLGLALVRVADTSDEWIARSAAIATNCADNYSLEAMVDAMIGAVVGDAAPHPHVSR